MSPDNLKSQLPQFQPLRITFLLCRDYWGCFRHCKYPILRSDISRIGWKKRSDADCKAIRYKHRLYISKEALIGNGQTAAERALFWLLVQECSRKEHSRMYKCPAPRGLWCYDAGSGLPDVDSCFNGGGTSNLLVPAFQMARVVERGYSQAKVWH